MFDPIDDKPRFYGLDSLNPEGYPEDVIDDVLYRCKSTPFNWHPDLMPLVLVLCGGSLAATVLLRMPFVLFFVFSPMGFVLAMAACGMAAAYFYVADRTWQPSVVWVLLIPTIWVAATLNDVCGSLRCFYFFVFPWELVGLVGMVSAIGKNYIDYLVAGEVISLESREALDADWKARWQDPWYVQSVVGVAIAYLLGGVLVVSYELGWPGWLAKSRPAHASVVLLGVAVLFFLAASWQFRTPLKLIAGGSVGPGCWRAVDNWLRYSPRQQGADSVFAPSLSLHRRLTISFLAVAVVYASVLPAASFFPLALCGSDLTVWRCFAPGQFSDEQFGGVDVLMSRDELHSVLNHRPDSWIQLAVWGAAVRLNEHAFLTITLAIVLSALLPVVLLASIVLSLLAPIMPYYQFKVALAAAIESHRFEQTRFTSNKPSR